MGHLAVGLIERMANGLPLATDSDSHGVAGEVSVIRAVRSSTAYDQRHILLHGHALHFIDIPTIVDSVPLLRNPHELT